MILECAIAKIRKSEETTGGASELITEYFYKATNDFYIKREGQINEVSQIMPFALELSDSNELKQIKLEPENEENDIIVFYKNATDKKGDYTALLMERVPHATPSIGASGLEEKSINEFIKYHNNSNINMVSAHIMRQIIDSKENKYFIKRAGNQLDYKQNWTIYLFEESGTPFLFPIEIENKKEPEKSFTLSPSNYYVNGIQQIKINKNACDEIPKIKLKEDYALWLGQCITGLYDYTQMVHNCKFKHITLEDRILLFDKVDIEEKNYKIVMEVSNKKEDLYEQALMGNEREAIKICKEELLKNISEFGNREYADIYFDKAVNKEELDKKIDEWRLQAITLQTQIDKRIAELFNRI